MFSEERFAPVAVLAVAHHGSARMLLPERVSCAVCRGKGGCDTLLPKLVRAGGSGNGDGGMQPVLGGLRGGRRGGRFVRKPPLGCAAWGTMWSLGLA